MKTTTSIILLLLAVLIALTATGLAMLFVQGERRPPDPTANVQTPTRMEVNNAVVRLIQAGRADELYAFYAQDVGDPIRAWLYCSAALINHAPVNYVESIGWWEGGHQVGTVGAPNENGSVDYRPMGLNSVTYKQYTPAELQALEFNIPAGIQHLVDERSRWGISWEAAWTSYNHGSPKGLTGLGPSNQVDALTAIVRHEWELDRRFAARFPDAL